MKKARSKAKRKSSGGQVSNKEITDLQEILLEAVLLNKPLPGSQKPIRFPDLSILLNQPTIQLITENLAGPISLQASPKPIDLVSRSEAIQESRGRAGVAYLNFHPPKVGNNEVELTLSGRMIPQDPSQGELGLSSVHVKFRKTNGEWVAVDDPIYSAA